MGDYFTKGVELITAGCFIRYKTHHGENAEPSGTERALEDDCYHVLTGKTDTQFAVAVDLSQV